MRYTDEASSTRTPLCRGRKTVQKPTNPCGDNCYVLLSSELARGVNEPCGSKANTGESDCEWMDAEQSLLRAVYVIHLNNYCAIADILMTKTCKQV